MADPRHLKVLAKGVPAWNKWRRGLYRRRDLVTPDLSGASLFGKDLSHVDFTAVDLSGCDLRCARLWEVDFSGADLAGTRLAGASLLGCRFAPLVRIFTDKEIRIFPGVRGSAFAGVGPNVSEAELGWTTIEGIDLSKWTGLESVKHVGLFVLGVSTLTASRGRIPERFLRRSGVPDSFVVYAKSLAENPIEMHSCFVSFASGDQEFADRLYTDLVSRGVDCWYAPRDAKPGLKLHEQIDEAVHAYEKLLLLLSPLSMRSEWVKTEISKARHREVREKRRVLFPISLVPFETLRDWECFDADLGKDSAREIREYYIPQFDGWRADQDRYEKELDRVIVSLKRGAESVAGDKHSTADGR